LCLPPQFGSVSLFQSPTWALVSLSPGAARAAVLPVLIQTTSSGFPLRGFVDQSLYTSSPFCRFPPFAVTPLALPDPVRRYIEEFALFMPTASPVDFAWSYPFSAGRPPTSFFPPMYPYAVDPADWRGGGRFAVPLVSFSTDPVAVGPDTRKELPPPSLRCSHPTGISRFSFS